MFLFRLFYSNNTTLSYFRKFIRNFAAKSHAIANLKKSVGPWKKGCKLAFDTREVMTDCPIEPVCVTIDEKVKGKQPLNLSVPLTVNPQVFVNDPDAVHTIHLAFQGPKG